MGSVRRRIKGAAGACAGLVPGGAWAQDCAVLRPNWDGTPATSVSEAIALFSTVPSLVLLIATAFVIRTRKPWAGLTVVCLWTLWTGFIAFGTTPVQTAAMVQGCIGPSTLFIGIVCAICIGLILYCSPSGDKEPG